MLYIQLSNLKFHAFHGVYEEERILGNAYEVNLKAGFFPKKIFIQHLEDTVDYTAIYKIVSEIMAEPTPLLETVAGKIVEAITTRYAQIEELKVSIKKLYPPVNNFEGRVGVSFEWKKDTAR